MFQPKNEQGVVALFIQQMSQYDVQLIKIQTGFPDAVIRYKGENYTVEFEFIASNFIDHKHDIEKCHLIVCWEDNLGEGFAVPILSLRDDWQESLERLGEEVPLSRLKDYWRERYFALLEQTQNGTIKNSAGRPPKILNPKYVALLLKYPSIGRSKAIGIFGMSQLEHTKNKKFALRIREEMKDLDSFLEEIKRKEDNAATK